jgi:uncharacterized protein YecE (DUF72 family)
VTISRPDTLDADMFKFRGLHPDVFMGTASDRYAGWIGQIYSPDLYQGRMTSRVNKVGGKSFKEDVLPVDSVKEYFHHFRVLEIDYTFYRPLLNNNGEATQNFHVLSSYKSQLTDDDSIILKVPQTVFARKLLRGGVYVENDDYLNADVFARSFYEPAVGLLGSNLKGFIFEQEYQRKGERCPPEELASDLSDFFNAIPRDDRYHIELRTESYLSRPVFDVLRSFGVGQVLSHWTWLPPLSRQFAKADHGFLNSGRLNIIRLMTPLGTRYEDAYAKAHPFDRLVEGMLQPRMIEEATELIWEGIHQQTQISVVINNRSGGNAPLIAQLIAKRFMEGP